MNTIQNDLARQSKLHARTLAVLNHCVGTARRDAACDRLFNLLKRESWPLQRGERRKIYEECAMLSQEMLDATQKSSPILYNAKLALADRPLLHFFHLIQQLVQTILSLSQHIDEVEQEAQLLTEHLGSETWKVLTSTCQDFEQQEHHACLALQKVIPVGEALVHENSRQRIEKFTAEDKIRYDKAYKEYSAHYGD